MLKHQFLISLYTSCEQFWCFGLQLLHFNSFQTPLAFILRYCMLGKVIRTNHLNSFLIPWKRGTARFRFVGLLKTLELPLHHYPLQKTIFGHFLIHQIPPPLVKQTYPKACRFSFVYQKLSFTGGGIIDNPHNPLYSVQCVRSATTNKVCYHARIKRQQPCQRNKRRISLWYTSSLTLLCPTFVIKNSPREFVLECWNMRNINYSTLKLCCKFWAILGKNYNKIQVKF